MYLFPVPILLVFMQDIVMQCCPSLVREFLSSKSTLTIFPASNNRRWKVFHQWYQALREIAVQMDFCLMAACIDCLLLQHETQRSRVINNYQITHWGCIWDLSRCYPYHSVLTIFLEPEILMLFIYLIIVHFVTQCLWKLQLKMHQPQMWLPRRVTFYRKGTSVYICISKSTTRLLFNGQLLAG